MLVGSLPDPTSPGIIAVTSLFFGFFGTTHALWRELPQDDVRWTAFLWGYLGVGLGLLIYCFGLAASYIDLMRRNVFITEFILPIVVAAAMILPIFVIERLVFGWSKEALGVTEIVGGGLFVFIWTPLGSWLAPRIGLPAPTGIAKRRSDLYR